MACPGEAVLEPFWGHNERAAYPAGKSWDRQPVSGKLRRKLGVSPGFAGHFGAPPPKRLGAPGEASRHAIIGIPMKSRVFVTPKSTVLDPQGRSEEHTSELQSLRHLVCRLLLEKKQLSTPVIK